MAQNASWPKQVTATCNSRRPWLLCTMSTDKCQDVAASADIVLRRGGRGHCETGRWLGAELGAELFLRRHLLGVSSVRSLTARTTIPLLTLAAAKPSSRFDARRWGPIGDAESPSIWMEFSAELPWTLLNAEPPRRF